MYIYYSYSIRNNSGPRTLVRIVEVSVIGGVCFRRFHCIVLNLSKSVGLMFNLQVCHND